MPVRYYSAGMMVRLAFSIATAIEPEVLLVDEVLSVGDMAFQDKARQRMRDMMAKARTDRHGQPRPRIAAEVLPPRPLDGSRHRSAWTVRSATWSRAYKDVGPQARGG